MADVPRPRSKSDIVGDMLATFLSRTGLPSARTGSPHLSIIEAAAQSDLRSSQDIFNLLASQDLDRATGVALDNIGASESVQRIGSSPASGFVTITDTSFTKIQTKLFQGLPPPIIGAAAIYVAEGASLPATGSVYIGRGTSNYEGPLEYTSKVNNTSYWTLNLASGSHTAKYHNLGETVVLAQGGDRLVPAGTLVQTPQGNAGTAIQFSVLYVSTVPDGETSVNSVTVTATQSGLIGNAAANTISGFASAPFVGASVINDLPFTNGLATEDDDAYRERIRDARQSRARGTPLAIQTFVTGITALDENKRVLSSSVVTREGYPTTLYIDDGTGYEEQDIGIPLESITDEALGGEQYFQLVHGQPVTKAYAVTTSEAPFNLAGSSALSVLVGGVTSTHTFSPSSFRAISAASAYEVAASINANPVLLFGARTTNSGSRVALTARADTNEDIEVIAPPAGFVDANLILGFAAGRVDSLRLYRNDRLLSKDGQLATVTSNPQGVWATLPSPCTFKIIVDGVNVATSPINTFSITDTDFVDAGTGYTTVSSTNSLAAWAKVLNYKIPGITAVVSGGSLALTSNKGRSNSASIAIDSCDLVVAGIFAVGTSTGKNADYTLNRNLGHLRLNDSLVLEANDRLSAGSIATRAFLETEDLGSLTINASDTTVSGQSGAELWLAVDGLATIVKTNVTTSTGITVSLANTTTFDRVRFASTTSTALFGNVAVGDWVLATDLGFTLANRGAFRVADVDPSDTWIEIERPTSWASPEAISLLTGGLIFVRTAVDVQRIYIPAAVNYTANSLVTLINTQIRGATAALYRTNSLRIRTNSFLTGDIALVAANAEGLKLTILPASNIANETSHLAALEAGNGEAGTPSFTVESISTVASSTVFDVSAIGSIGSEKFIVGLKALEDVNGSRYSNKGHYTPIEVIASTTITTRRAAVKEWLPADRIYAAVPYAMTGNDQMTVVVDGDTDSKRFVTPMYRRITPVATTYGITGDYTDADNNDVSLAVSFGLGMSFKDFAVFMPGRTKSHRIGGVDTNKSILWRYKRLGLEGNRARIQYGYPTIASAATTVTLTAANAATTDITVKLPSGVARTGVTISNSTRLGATATAGPTAGLYDLIQVLNLPIASGEREVRLDYNTKTAGWAVGETVTGVTSGATGVIGSVVGGAPGAAAGVIIFSSSTGLFISGENLTGSVSGANIAKATNTQYGVVKLTLTLPTGVTNHGFTVGNRLHVRYNGTGTGAGFVSSAPTISVLEVPSGSTINFIEGYTTIGVTAGIGTVSYDNIENKTTGSTVVVGDIMALNNGVTTTAVRVASIADGYVTYVNPVGTVSGTLTWTPINSTANLTFFPLGTSTITAIATAVNAQGATSPVTAVAIGDGADTSGSVTYATYEATPNGLGGTDPWYYLSDGLNWIRSNTNPGSIATNYNFTFKEAITASLATNSDWINEDIRLVPITASNVVDYLNTSAPGGLFASADISLAEAGTKPQIASLTVGSAGSVQVQGGTANSLSAAVRGQSSLVASTYSLLSIDASDALALSGGHWVMAQNTVTVPKERVTSATDLVSIDALGNVVWTGTKAWEYANTAAALITGRVWQVEKQGKFVAYQYVSGTAVDLAGVQEGDIVHVSSQVTSATVNVRNQGFFRIIRLNNTTKTFWIENTNVLEETATVDLAFLKYDSILPGDTIVIGTTDWGTDNLGTWTVSSIDLQTINNAYTGDEYKFALDITARTPQVIVSPGPGALGTGANLVRVVEGLPSRLFKRVYGISVNPLDSNLVDVKFDTASGLTKMSEAAGTTLISLDKLAFSSTVAVGIDGYRHSIGLIQEANRVGYGVESDPSTYPGVIAAGANVNIQGPLVKRISVSLAIRTRTGVSAVDIKDQVKSAVAAAINETGIGTPVAISVLIDTAQSVNGVVAVTILSPNYGPGQDLVSVQPFEKPMVLNLDDDIQVSFVGE